MGQNFIKTLAFALKFKISNALKLTSQFLSIKFVYFFLPLNSAEIFIIIT